MRDLKIPIFLNLGNMRDLKIPMFSQFGKYEEDVKSLNFLNLRNVCKLKITNFSKFEKYEGAEIPKFSIWEKSKWLYWTLLGREIKTVNVHHYSSSISYFHFEHIFITIIIIAVTMISVVMMISVVTTMISATYFLVVRGRTYSCCSRHLGWKPCRREYFVAIISIILMILVIILMKLESCENFYSDEISLTYFFVDVKSREIEIAPFYETGRNVNHKFPLGFLLEGKYVYTFKQSSLQRSWKWHKLKKHSVLSGCIWTFGTFRSC